MSIPCIKCDQADALANHDYCSVQCANAAIVDWLSDPEHVAVLHKARELYAHGGTPELATAYGGIQAAMFLFKMEITSENYSMEQNNTVPDEEATIRARTERFELIKNLYAKLEPQVAALATR